MKVLVLDNYDSFTYNLVQYLGELGAEVEVVRNDKATVADARPDYELRESEAKSRAVKQAVELAVAQPDWP